MFIPDSFGDGIKVACSSVKRNLKHLFCLENRLKILLCILFISSIILSGCGDQSAINMLNDCMTQEITGPSTGDPRLLCIGTGMDLNTNPTCLIDKDFEDASWKDVNQMYANLFLTLLVENDGAEDAMANADFIDAAAISADCIFGDCKEIEATGDPCQTDGKGSCDDSDYDPKYECYDYDLISSDYDCTWEAGFWADRNPSGSDDAKMKGASSPDQTGNCVKKKSFNVDILASWEDSSHYGPEWDNVDILKDAGITKVPAVFVCHSEGDGYNPIAHSDFEDDGGKLYTSGDNVYFDLYIEDNGLDGYLVTQTIEIDCNQTEIRCGDDNKLKKQLIFRCDFDANDGLGAWVPLHEYQYDLDYDLDADGALNGIVDMDCDNNNPTIFPDLSIFDGFEEIIPTDVCNDGLDNGCKSHKIYKQFKDLYAHNKITDSDGDLINPFNDNCDTNPTACDNNCLKLGNRCDYLTAPADEDNDGIDNTDYVTPDDAEGYCCGADQIDDVGVAIEDEDDNQKICFSKDKNVVGTKFDLAGSEKCEGDDYCWLNPADPKFNIFTLKEVSKTPYDVISDGRRWFFCNESNYNYSLKTVSSEHESKVDSRFYCFDQGDSYAWAECANEDAKNEGSFKHSTAGDGLFRFPSPSASPDTQTILILSDLGFNDYYEQKNVANQPYFSFEGYDFLEFYVNFDDNPSFPVDIILKVKSDKDSNGDDIVYFDQQVLGFAVNTPQLDGDNKSIHIKIPIEEWINVKELVFESTADQNSFTISNVFLSTDSSDPLICSGKESTVGDFGSYIGDVDYSQVGTEVNGEEICKSYYGSDAWFGESAVYEEVSIMDASCCGDDQGEYYAGQTQEGIAIRGCWNGNVVYNDETMMNVEYTVDYNLVEYNVSYPGLDYNVGHPGFDDRHYETEVKGTINAKKGKKVVFNAALDVKNHVNYSKGKESVIVKYGSTNSDNVDIYWFIKEEQKKINNAEAEFSLESYPYPFTLQLIAETNYVEVSNTTNSYSDTYTFPCTDTECTYGLPGSPPYTITNNYPHLYELYFVNNTDEETDILITGTDTFNTPGNVRAKKISQQVLFTTDEDDKEGDFWGCETGDLIPTGVYSPEFDHDATKGENLPQCSIKGSYYCAFQDNNFLINSWSQDSIEEYGYEPKGVYVEDDYFEPATCGGDLDCTATARNQSTYAVPGRNIITNPSFEEVSGKDIFGWELLDSNNQFDYDEKENLVEETFNVPSGSTLKISKLALMQNKDYYFSSSGDCDSTIYLVNVNGNQTSVGSTSFNSGDNIYVSIEFSGSCSLEDPMLQLVDDNPLGVNSFNNPQDYMSMFGLNSDDYPSKGAACCPESWCWNGFMCVESMDKTTYLHEDINNRTYRCIDGAWSYLDPKYDWNQEEWGFCNSADQCFVTSSLSEGANPDATPEDFYGSDLSDPYATCINNGEYIFDHYCNAGEWMSRTRFLVTKLLDYAENDDYVLSCDRPQNNLLDYDVPGYGYNNYIIGGSSAEVTNVSTLTESLNGTTTSVSTVDVCFNSIETSDTGKRLVPTEENTCINNVCVLRYNSGDEFKTAFATSMNIPLNDSNSFLIPLEEATSGTAVDYCVDEVSSSNQFVDCTENVKYSSKINSLIYSEDDLSISTSVIDNVFEWFGDLFTGDEDEETEEFLDNSVNYNKVYLTSLNNDQYIVRSIEDVTPEGRMILSEYSGFDFDVCDYVLNMNEEYVYDPQWPDVPEPLVNCNVSDDGVYQVSAAAYTDFWWPQLTSSLRIPNE